MSAGGAPPGAAVSLRGVRKRFGYRDVLRGIDLDVPSGSVFALHGPNGAGKSTLLRVVATQWTCSQGTVHVLGRDVRKEALWVRARIGVVFHESFLRREFTLEENLRFTCDLHGLRAGAARERIERLLERVGLAARRSDAVATFSQGMTKRASIARSLLNEPALWILDEPFSGLDADGRRRLEEMIGEFRAGGGTVLLVSHDAGLLARLADASARIEDGDLVRTGPGAAALEGAAMAAAEDAA
jgi:ABC-type multidrug transport system ATPase subunit